jgi:integrase
VKLTKRSVDAIPPGPPKGLWTADAELTGFFVVAYPHSKVFFVRYRIGTLRRVVRVGQYGALTVDQARLRAQELLAEAALGRDPAEDRRKSLEMPTFGTWAATYLDRVRLTKKAPKADERYLNIATARWKNKPLNTVEPEDVAAARQDLADTKTQANRWLASVRACLQAAIRAGHLKTNPAVGLKPFAENPARARVLDQDELEALLRAVALEEDVHARAALTVLVETGARLSEVLTAKWSDFDLEEETWRIPSLKAGKPQTIPLAKSTAALLRKLHRVGPYVILGRTAGKPRRDLKGPWARALDRAELTKAGLHIHDVRRTFGLAIAKHAGLHIASKLLRHGDIRITERVYAPLGLDDLRGALEKRAPVLTFKGKKKARKAG